MIIVKIIGLDMSVYSIGGEDLIATLQECSISTDRSLIDIAGIAQKSHYRMGFIDEEFTSTQIVDASPALWSSIQNGSEVYVEAGWTPPGGSQTSFSFYGYIGNNTVNVSGREDLVTEEVTIQPSRAAGVTLTTA